jgi:hypothetical protein
MTQRHRNSAPGTFSRQIDHQRGATSNGRVAPQVDWLAPRTVAAQVQIDAAGVYKQGDFHAALVWVMLTSGKSDKELAHLCSVDAPTFSRIKSAQAHVPTDRIPEILEGCENYGGLFWLLNRLGFDPASVRRQLSDVERELAEANDRIAELERERALMTKLWKETR